MTSEGTGRPDTAAPAPEGAEAGLRRLEAELRAVRRHSVRGMRELHAAHAADLRRVERQAAQAETRARTAEKSLAQAQRRARRAEAELAEVKSSSTWRAGRAVVAVPAKLKGLRRS